MQNEDLQREGATLVLRLPLSASSTQRDYAQEKDQESQIHDLDLNRRKMEQGKSEPVEELRVDTVGGDRLTLGLNPHHSEDEQTSDSTSTRSSESGG